jgi:hypothetical protein
MARPPPPALSPAGAPYDFSPATTTALVALVASKADDGQYGLTVTRPTSQRFSGYAPKWGTPYWPPELTFDPSTALLVRPQSAAQAALYQWRLRYRGRRQGGQLVADAAQDQLARGLMVQQALGWMNALDTRYGVGRTPNPEPDVSGMKLDPRGRVVGDLLGYAGPKIRGDE